ncbi:MAG: Gfo/Idh/MocA family protein [bacterium]
MNKILRIAIVGAGPRANDYMTAIVKLHDKYKLCAICDKNEQRGKEALKAHGAESLYTEVETMLEKEKPDVFFALTPTDSLSLMTIMAAEHKVNIIREIPIAITRQIAEAIIQACKDNNVKLEIAENVWMWPHERLKKKIIESGLLGDILHTRLWYTSGAYHGFNAIRMLLGKEAKRVSGYIGKVKVPEYITYGGEPTTIRIWESAIIEFEDGITCLFEHPIPGARNNFWDIEGTKGYLSGNELVLHNKGNYNIKHIYEETNGKQVLDHVRVDTDPPIIWENPYKQYGISETDEVAKASILCSMHKALTENTDLEYGAMNALRDLELCVAVHESGLRDGEWINLPLSGITEVESRIYEEYKCKYGHDPIKDIDALKNTVFTRASVIWTVAGWL